MRSKTEEMGGWFSDCDERGKRGEKREDDRDMSCGGWTSIYGQYISTCLHVFYFLSFEVLLLI